MGFIFQLFFCFFIVQVVYANYEVQHFFPDLNVVHLEQLSHNFAKMFKVREHDAIMTIVVNQQGYFAHKHILLSSSSYLRKQIQKSKTKDLIKIPHLELVHNDSFFHVLKYIYTGKLVLNNQNLDRVFDLMAIAKQLELTSVNDDISHILMKSLSLENVATIYEKANIYEQDKLKSYCESFIDQNAEIIFARKSLIRLPSLFYNRTFSLNPIVNTKLASGSNDNLIKIWNVDTGECIRTLVGHSSHILSLQSLSRNILASGSFDNSIKIWDLDSGECIRTLAGHSKHILTLQALSENRLASGSFDNSIKLWDIDSGECVRTFSQSNHVWSLQLLSNNRMASASNNNLIEIWDLDSGESVRTLTGHVDSVRSLQLLTNNKLASGSLDKTIRIWNLDSGECIRQFSCCSEAVWPLQLLDNNKLASISENAIQIWNYESGELIRLLTGHSSIISSLQLLSNNQLASGSWDNSIKIWNVETGECIRTLTGHSLPVFSLQSLPN